MPCVLKLLLHYGDFLFIEDENPISAFLDALSQNKLRVIGAVKEDTLIAFLILYNFKKISRNKFNCYIGGISQRNVAKDVDVAIKYVFSDLKEKGCISVRFETRKYNLPVRFMANRLGFVKVGILRKASFVNDKFEDNILYEKIL